MQLPIHLATESNASEISVLAECASSRMCSMRVQCKNGRRRERGTQIKGGLKNREAKRETESKRESVQSVGMQAGEECGFHGNPRKAELWVSVPALHCTGPRLSATTLSLSL